MNCFLRKLMFSVIYTSAIILAIYIRLTTWYHLCTFHLATCIPIFHALHRHYILSMNDALRQQQWMDAMSAWPFLLFMCIFHRYLNSFLFRAALSGYPPLNLSKFRHFSLSYCKGAFPGCDGNLKWMCQRQHKKLPFDRYQNWSEQGKVILFTHVKTAYGSLAFQW